MPSPNLLLVRPGDRDARASDELHSLGWEGLLDPRSSLGNEVPVCVPVVVDQLLAEVSDDEELALILADCAPERSSLLTQSAGVEHLPPAA